MIMKKNNKKKGIDYDKYILKKYLHNKIYNLQPNKFPYDLEKNIKHYVLWLNPAIKNNLYIIKNLLNLF